ncbi:MAG TPA: serine hydrolase domain-containing protein [Thermoanaerobaculia bacterium]|jgi:CubicO group peptidase (beta-lactamase class C family)
MRQTVLRLLVFSILAAGVVQAAEPGEQRARGWVEAFNSGDDETLDRYAAAHLTPEALNRREPAIRRASYRAMFERHGKLEIVSAAVDNGILLLQAKPERGDPVTVRFRIEPSAPHRIEGVAIVPRRAPGAPALPPLTLPGKTSGEVKKVLDPYLAWLAAQDSFAGTVAVARNGVILFEAAYGLASRRYDVPHKTSTRINLGSITKELTQVAIAQLADAGKLDLDVPIVKYLPQYPNQEVAKKVTIRQLLTHTSGLGDIYTERFNAVSKLDFDTVQRFIDFFAPDPLQFEPGTREKYSNYGFAVLGAVVEAVSGERYYDYIHKHVLRAAGMETSGFFDLLEITPDLAMGHTKAMSDAGPVWLENTLLRYNTIGFPGGGSYSTAREMVLFDRAVRTAKLTSAKSAAWILRHDARTDGAFTALRSVAGGSVGVNAQLSGDGIWTVAVLANMDPPIAQDLGDAIFEALRR